MAFLAATIGNSVGGKKDGGAFAWDDFIPNLDAPPVETQPADTLKEQLLAAFEAMGADVVRIPAAGP